jgi:hypothetical protein
VGRTVLLVVAGLLVALCSCGTIAAAGYYSVNQATIDSLIQAIATTTPQPPRNPTRTATPDPDVTRPVATPRPAEPGGTGPLREQWGTGATASSEYANPQFSALQAAGPPNTPRCGDFETAWASAKKTPTEWIEVKFAVPVRATRVVIYESFRPGRVVQVDLREPNGTLHTVFKGRDPTTTCPGEFAPQFPPTTFLSNAVRVYVEDPPDREAYAEIDAVQLVGYEGT